MGNPCRSAVKSNRQRAAADDNDADAEE